ncbi:protein RADIALIS-like 3 [Triticum urartu]|uniref:protein RADIALIS-like 3 n=1 Tax=Triticum urartu TaxID=4572 RepID=UPI002043B972|nr:protein RADIALIS-like 3 [Triticum urartu]
MSSGSSSRSTSPSSDSEWTKKENKMFEEALAYYGVSAPNLWDKVASAMGGTKSAQQVRRHFQILVDDVESIEHGRIPFPKYKTRVFGPKRMKQCKLQWTVSKVVQTRSLRMS